MKNIDGVDYSNHLLDLIQQLTPEECYDADVALGVRNLPECNMFTIISFLHHGKPLTKCRIKLFSV